MDADTQEQSSLRTNTKLTELYEQPDSRIIKIVEEHNPEGQNLWGDRIIVADLRAMEIE